MSKNLSDYTLEYENPATTWVEVVQIASGIKPVIGKAVPVEATSQDDAVDAYIIGNVKSLDEVSFELFWDPALTSHAYLKTNIGSEVNFRTTLKDGATTVYTQKFFVLSVDVSPSANNAPGMATVTLQATEDAA